MTIEDVITVIVPIYNVENYLSRCIESIISQTYHNLEIILVDDGSTDSSSQICDYYRKIDNRIKVFHKINGGLSDARNIGLKNASGKYVSFIDSDDFVDEDFIEIMYKNIKKYDAEVSEINYRLVNDYKQFRPKRRSYFQIIQTENLLIEFFSGNVIENNVVIKLFKKEIVDDLLFKLDYTAEDMFFTYCVLKKCSTVVVDTRQTKYNYYMRENSIVNQKPTEHIFDSIKLCELMLSDVTTEFKKFAYAKLIREKMKFVNKIYSSKDSVYKKEMKLYLKDIRSYSFFEAVKYLSTKHFFVLYLMKVSPYFYNKIYIKFQKQ